MASKRKTSTADKVAEDQFRDIESKLETCENNIERLNAWEQNFLESVRDEFDRKATLSPGRVSKLEEVYQKAIKFM